MPASEDFDPFENESTAASRTGGRNRQPELVATGDVAGARLALEGARGAVEAAQDALADAEGRVAVLEFKVQAVEADPEREEWEKAEVREDLARARRAFRRAGAVVETQEQMLEAASEQLDTEERALAAPTGDAGAAAGAAVVPRFATVELFVEMFVLPNWVHKYVATRVRWCEVWWEHAEAITRLEALWEAFEVMRLQPAPSFSTWLRDHFDVHMRTLTDPEGVFYDCDAKEGMHTPHLPWKARSAPTGMFAALEAAQIQPPPAPSTGSADGAGLGDLDDLGGLSAGGSVVSEARSIKSTSPSGIGASSSSTRTTRSGVSR